MRRWFLSYNSQDLALAQGFEEALRRKAPDDRIFVAPKILRLGGFWLPELAREIAEASAFVLLVGKNGLGPWQVIEYYEALDRRVKERGFPVILVILEGQPAPGLPFLRQLHWIITTDPASEKSLARTLDAAAGEGASPGDLWRYTAPYRGLAAMTESDTDFFFGRERETVEVITALATMPHRLPVLLGNSGVGKSSLAQAGVLAALMRQSWPERGAVARAWPQAFNDSRRWCLLKLRPGTEPLRALVGSFLRAWQFDPTDPRREARQTEWVEALLNEKGTLRGLIDATEDRLQEHGQAKPPAFVLYVDQGEELYVRAEERQRRRFSEVLAQGLVDQRLRALMSLRADFLGDLQRDEALYKAHCKVDVPPLREAELRQVVSRPAEILSARFETDRLAHNIAERSAEESAKDAGALPFLSYLLDDMWTQMVHRGDGILRLPVQAIEPGGVLVERANAFLACHPKSEDQLRRIFTLKLAEVREDGLPTRRRALRSEFSQEEWRLVTELADHPNRLLITVTPESGETVLTPAADIAAQRIPSGDQTYAEVAHEAIFRRWDKLRDWIAAEREFLAWRSRLEGARRAWQATPDDAKSDALLLGFALAQAQSWLAKRAEDLQDVDRKFVALSVEHERAERRQAGRMRALVGLLAVGIVAGVGYAGWSNRSYLTVRLVDLADVLPRRALTASDLQPGKTFSDCSHCPEMIIVPAGEFWMGSRADEKGHQDTESPRHKVVIAKAFAVSRFEVTFAEWDACFYLGGCSYLPGDQGWGRGRQPVVNVSWDDVQKYVSWIARRTGKPYRLLSEAEWEYAARAGSDTAYSWGDEIGRGNANCESCGSKWDNRQTAPVGSFTANAFGLHDMHGNVWEWVQDCFRHNYDGAPTDGLPNEVGDCSTRVIRGGSWSTGPQTLRAADRVWQPRNFRASSSNGFRVARALAP
jgi:formylglycine-generating enzyme required for sulfatase activity